MAGSFSLFAHCIPGLCSAARRSLESFLCNPSAELVVLVIDDYYNDLALFAVAAPTRTAPFGCRMRRGRNRPSITSEGRGNCHWALHPVPDSGVVPSQDVGQRWVRVSGPPGGAVQRSSGRFPCLCLQRVLIPGGNRAGHAPRRHRAYCEATGLRGTQSHGERVWGKKAGAPGSAGQTC